MPIKLTTETFVKKAKEVHGNRYRYSKVEYKANAARVSIFCVDCSEYFEQTPQIHLRGGGCQLCKAKKASERFSIGYAEFLRRAKDHHGARYTYKRTVFEKLSDIITIGCRTCRVWFEQSAAQHASGKGCQQCAGNKKSTTSEFESKSRKIHGELYDYSRVQYVNSIIKVDIACRSCESVFPQAPRSHLNGSGCPTCVKPGYSKVAIKWLEYEAKKRGIEIQHARNGGEFRVPKTKFRVDGYHAESNTIFEFHGDCYHGNPKRYSPRSKPNPYSDKTAARLYKETMAREESLKGLGYNVVSIWQMDFKALVKEGL